MIRGIDYRSFGPAAEQYADMASKCSLKTPASGKLCFMLLTKAYQAGWEYCQSGGEVDWSALDRLAGLNQKNKLAVIGRQPDAYNLRVVRPGEQSLRRGEKYYINRHILSRMQRTQRLALLAKSQRAMELRDLDRADSARIKRHHYVNCDHVSDSRRHETLAEW